MSSILSLIDDNQRAIFNAVKSHTSTLLDSPQRFNFFTLHGKQHINNLINIMDLFHDSGKVILTKDEAFLLLLAICIHDIGMVVPLSDKSIQEIIGIGHQIPDKSKSETLIRRYHHELVKFYFDQNFNFLTSLGIPPSDCSIVIDVAKAHREADLSKLAGLPKKVGTLLRLIDEFDIGPYRAPSSILLSRYKEMDEISCWHWFKHNIVESWRLDQNVFIDATNYKRTMRFEIIVHPPTKDSIQYWLSQIEKPIRHMLSKQFVGSIVKEIWGLDIIIEKSYWKSSETKLGSDWTDIQEKAIASGRKSILLIDDECRKMEDLLLPLEENFSIHYSYSARDAIEKMNVFTFDLIIVDMQIGSGGIWSAEETEDYKATGLKIVNEIKNISPKSKIGILTGTRYGTDNLNDMGLTFVKKKPILPDEFERLVFNVLKD